MLLPRYCVPSRFFLIRRGNSPGSRSSASFLAQPVRPELRKGAVGGGWRGNAGPISFRGSVAAGGVERHSQGEMRGSLL